MGRRVASLLLVLLSSLLPLVIPLARNLEYEYASLNAYLLLLVLPIGLYVIPGIAIPQPVEALRTLLFAAVLSFLPAFLMFRFGGCQCSEQGYWFWWVIQVLPHLILSYGVAWFMLKARADRRRNVLAVYFVIMGVLLFEMAWILWAMPQKRITHLVAGFIHGAIYDNFIGVDDGIVWARAGHLMVGLMFVSLALLGRRTKWISAGLAAGLSLTFSFVASRYPSTQHGLAALEELMPESRESRFFTLHYQKPQNDEQAEAINEIFASAEFHSQDIAKRLLIDQARVEIFVYPSRRDKKLWFGGDGTDITDVRTPSVHITFDAWPHGTLRHELVHAMASPFAFHGLGFHPNMAFTEGLAVALAPSEDDVSLHRGAATLLKEQKIDPLNLFSPLFWSESGGRAYTVAGSLIKYLMDHYGLERVKGLYAGATWQETFGKETSPILQEWMAFLQTNYMDDKDDIAAEALYRYPGLLGDLCPHSKADLSNNSKSIYIGLRQPRDWDEERDYWPWRVSLDHSAGARLQLLRWEYFHVGPSEALLTRIRNEFAGGIKAVEDVEARSLIFDTLMGLGRNQEAEAVINSLLREVEKFKIGDGNLRQIWSRKMLVDLPGAEAKVWLQLLGGKAAAAPQGDLEHQPWLLDYLFLRNHRFTDDDSELLDKLTLRAVPKDLPVSFAVEWWKFLGRRRFELKDYEAAAQSLQNAAELAPEGSRDALMLAADEAHYILRLAKAKAHNARH